MKAVLGQLQATILELIVLAVAAYLIYKKVTGDALNVASALPSTQVLADSAASIVKNTPSVIVDLLKGNTDQGYITREQQAAMSLAALAKKRAQVDALAG